MFDSLGPHGLQTARLLCPWDFPGKSTEVGCHFYLPGLSKLASSKKISGLAADPTHD